MADSPDNSAGDGEKAEPEAIKAPAGEAAGANGEKPVAEAAHAADSSLPMVEAPKLGAGEEAVLLSEAEAMNEAPIAPAAPAGDEAAPAARARSSRFALLAAAIALAAGLGSFFGSLSASGIERLFAPAAPASGEEEFSATVQAMKAQFAALSAIKAHLDDATRSTTGQFAKIADRLDRLDKLASAAPEVTGSIASSPPPSPPAIAPMPPTVDGWIVQDVQNGRALVANRNGGVFDVGAGSLVPGLGRVDAIKRQDGQWIVVTVRGTITSGH
jgi:hypothetical protein